MRKNAPIFLIIVVVASIIAGFFVYPGYIGEERRPWKLGLDLVGGSHLVYQMDLSEVAGADRGSVVGGIRDVIERRVNLFGVSEPQIFVSKEDSDKPELVVELAGIKDVGEAIKVIGETPFLEFKEVDDDGSFIGTNLTGRFVTGAQMIFDQTTYQPQVSIAFNGDGAEMFAQMTERNIGRPIAIFLDNEIISAPIVQEMIPGGNALISGSFTRDEARTLVERFNAGALPAPITLISQQTVSASLGADSLNKVLYAGAIGTILVMLFMVVYYGRLGIFSSLALVMYIAFTLAIFKLIPITMTLAGIAGFVLTIGMAIDANILIFERMKEEAKKGLPYASSVEEGFKRAWASIRDSNTSTIITAVILYYFTSSFVRGFALALLLGTVVSMFSAITTTRLFLYSFNKKS